MAWVGLVVGELHALARHATTDGKEDLNQPLTRAWSVPASRVLRPLLDWSDPYTVYLTYGKIWLPVFAAFTLCAFVVQQRRRPAGLEKWVWRVALTGYVIATLSVFGDYYTPWTDQSFLLLSVPGLLISLLGSTVLGIVLLHHRFRPRSSAWLLALCIPLLIGIVQVTSLGNAALPVIFAFGIAGRRIARDQPVAASGPACVLTPRYDFQAGCWVWLPGNDDGSTQGLRPRTPGLSSKMPVESEDKTVGIPSRRHPTA